MYRLPEQNEKERMREEHPAPSKKRVRAREHTALLFPMATA